LDKLHRNNIIIYLGDLEYFNSYTESRWSIPLNIGYIASYVQKLYGANCQITLFKDAKKLMEQIKTVPPDILGLSCYCWNVNLDMLIAKHLKMIHPPSIVLLGGWNIDTDTEMQQELYGRFKGNADILVVNEGELGVANVVGRYILSGVNHFFEKPIDGCTFFVDKNVPVMGQDVGLSLDLNNLPSPILNGLLDEFLTPRFMPMVQTSRLCPYSCTYCCSGKVKGKLRHFPVEGVKSEIEYIAKKYQDSPHKYLFITDENFGIGKQDLEIAHHLVQTGRHLGYPKQIFVYFDKVFSERLKEIVLAIADINAGGVTLPFQSMNPETVQAIQRKNLGKDETEAVINWVHEHKLPVYSELIFGLPYETKQSFLDGIEYLITHKINMIVVHNLIMLMGSLLNRKSERRRFNLQTKFRPPSEPEYDEVEGEFVCESEEIAVASSHFSFEDNMEIRKISLLLWAIFNAGYFSKVMAYLVEKGEKMIPLLNFIMDPPHENFPDAHYSKFIVDFEGQARSELYDTMEEVMIHMRQEFEEAGHKVKGPTRLNAFYTSRLIYRENWFGPLLEVMLGANGERRGDREIVNDLIRISENEWVDFADLGAERQVKVCGGTLEFLGLEKPQSGGPDYTVILAVSKDQKEVLNSFLKNYSSQDEFFHYNALNIIQPRKLLRYGVVTVKA
jgi:radical SAM superfamily enzyme YgiQ (UPF0313 family)